MAYKNLLALSLSNSAETFRHFRDFLCKRNGSAGGSADYSTLGIGWTLVDSYYAAGGVDHYYDNTGEATIAANDYIVVYSAGEDGFRDLYYKITYATTAFTIAGYLYWNDTTHAGVNGFGTGSFWYNTAATNNILWVYGDMDFFIGISKYATTYYTAMVGWMPDSAYDQTVVTSTGAISAGSSVTVTLSSVPAAWEIGHKVFVKDLANIERVIISGISGSDVTFTTFVASYSSGAKFSREITTVSGPTNGNGAGGHNMQIGHNGTKDYACSKLLTALNPTSGTDFVYPSTTVYYPCSEIYLDGTATDVVGPLPHHYYTLSTFTSESTHTVGAVNYRYFNLYSGMYALIKEV